MASGEGTPLDSVHVPGPGHLLPAPASHHMWPRTGGHYLQNLSSCCCCCCCLQNTLAPSMGQVQTRCMDDDFSSTVWPSLQTQACSRQPKNFKTVTLNSCLLFYFDIRLLCLLQAVVMSCSCPHVARCHCRNRHSWTCSIPWNVHSVLTNACTEM